MKISAILSLVALFITFVSQILVNRILGPQGRGEYAVLMLIPMALGPLLAFGFSTAVVYYYHKDPSSLRKNLLVAVGTILSLGILTIPLISWIQKYALAGGQTFAASLFTAFVGSLVIGLATYALGAAQLKPSAYAYDKIRVFQVGTVLIGIVGLMVAHQMNANYIFGVYIASFGLQALLALAFVGTIAGKTSSPAAIAPASIRAFIGFAGAGFAADACATLAVSLDKFIVVRNVSLEEFGLYTAAFTLSRFFFPLAQALASRTFSEAAALPQEERAARTISNTRFVLVVSLLTAAPLVIAPSLGLEMLYGSGFKGASLSLFILAFESVIAAVMWNLSQVFGAMGQPHLAAFRQFSGVVVLGGCAFLLVPKLGITGAACSVLLATLVRAGVTVSLVARDYAFSWRMLLPKRKDWDIVSKEFSTGLAWFRRNYEKNI